MDVIIEYWSTWLFFSVALAFIMHFVAKNKKSDIQPGMATTSDTFSMKKIFLSFRTGEAALFFQVIIIMGFFSFFAIGFSKKLMSVIMF